jgi:DNA-binding MarR family transcriptional regulator
VSELAELTGTTKQAASKLVDSMEAAGYVVRVVDRTDTRRHPISLTRRGRRLLDAVEEIYAESEARWASVVGAGTLEDIRGGLVAVLADVDGHLPPVRPTW